MLGPFNSLKIERQSQVCTHNVKKGIKIDFCVGSSNTVFGDSHKYVLGPFNALEIERHNEGRTNNVKREKELFLVVGLNTPYLEIFKNTCWTRAFISFLCSLLQLQGHYQE